MANSGEGVPSHRADAAGVPRSAWISSCGVQVLPVDPCPRLRDIVGSPDVSNYGVREMSTASGAKNFRNGLTLFVVGFLGAVAILSFVIWRISYVSELDQLGQRGQADLALASDGLRGQLERYRELAVLLADHPEVRPVVFENAATPEVEQLLRETADKTGSLDIAILGSDGVELANAGEMPRSSHRGTNYFERGMDGALGVGHLYSDRFKRRAFLFAAPIFSPQGPVAGVVLVTANVELVEAAWRGDRPALFFTDEAGVVFLSNRSELLFRTRAPEAPQAADVPAERLLPFVSYDERPIAGRDLWAVDGGRYLPRSALHLTLPLPTIDMVGEALIDVAPARRLALLEAAFAASLCLAFGAFLLLAAQRRRSLAEANARLEARVAARTADLERLNSDLRQEIATRSAAEAGLKKAQADLVQAGKLSALGQMSAGISHELNQPLMAIRSFAENAQAFLDREKPEVAAQNLGRISELARRMGRIIQNLRAFARQETAPLAEVDLVAVVEATIEISAARARQEAVELCWNKPDKPVLVRAGDVRLQQVLLNLIGNAIDAMEGQPEKRVEVAIKSAGQRVALEVRDTGPGIAEPEKIFDPFYSTKLVGTGEGMGLGLSISYGLVQSFGGAIKGRNHPDGGAIFSVELDPMSKEAAA